ncbi:cytochrome c [Sorangium sp. So ce1036]|uniref:c-type cytochrome n=1 Tax=Sorangium sp. So ce1036 TaxID=3133328 RepID=UPI003F0CDADB
MPRRHVRALGRLLCTAVLLAGLFGCNSGSGDVREWTPADHDPPNPGQGQQAQGGKVAPRPAASSETDPGLIELAWQRNCATCHGATGRGDGPQGPMVRAPDLTDAAWQDRVADGQMAEVIRKGKNRMPPFDLPQSVIDGLVKRIRAQRAR